VSLLLSQEDSPDKSKLQVTLGEVKKYLQSEEEVSKFVSLLESYDKTGPHSSVNYNLIV
jgi:hypothetical protein